MFRLMVVTDRTRCRRPLIEVVRLAVEGGADAVQLRERNLSDRELFALAEQMRKVTAETDTKLIVNHRTDVALAVGADGVHLGWRSLRIKDARRLAGENLLIGASCHNESQLLSAQAAGADYILLGPVFPTPSKRGLVEPLGTDALRELVHLARAPVIAIGGIGPDNAQEIAGTGAAGIAAVSALMEAEDPRAAARQILEAAAIT